MKIAYLVNQYPKVSHSFIRREILALEAQGVEIKRFSIRSCGEQLVDRLDLEELNKTHFILALGIIGLLNSLVKTFLLTPRLFISALQLTLKIGYGSERGLLRHFAYLAEACVLSFLLKKQGIRHIHAHFGTNSTTVAMLCSVLGDFTYSFTIHGPEEFDQIKAIALPEKIQRALFVVTISSYGKSQVYRWCDYRDWQKIHIIHCGLEEKFITAQVSPIPNENNIVCVGRLCPQKGQLLLLEALGKLKTKGIDFQLTLVGDGELRQEVELLAKKLGIESQIEITGWASSDQVIEKIKQAKLMVLPSFAEGLPVVIMESLALGIPVISTYVAGIPELVVPEKSGWLVPASDIDSLVETIAKAINLPVETLQMMGKTGQEKVREQHNIEIEAGKLKDLLIKYLL
jgi:glycosyltransferase involved in cell wall biosynthesis